MIYLNKLLVKGDSIELEPFLKKMGVCDDGMVDFTFYNFLPIPRKLLEEKGISTSAWCTENWGCKLDAHLGADSFVYNDKIVIHFHTSETFPQNFVKNVSKKYPTLTFDMFSTLARTTEISSIHCRYINGESGFIRK